MLETEKQQLTQKLASVEEQYKKEIVELKVFDCGREIHKLSKEMVNFR
jgi:hypothetical protein